MHGVSHQTWPQVATKGVFATEINLQRAPVGGRTSQSGVKEWIESTVLHFRPYVEEFDFRRTSALSFTLDQ